MTSNDPVVSRITPNAFQRILQVERNDCLLLPLLQPKVPGNPAVMLIDLAVSLAPAVELAGRDVQPSDELPGTDLSLLRPAPHEIYDLVPRIVRNPDPGQSSPTLFFRATCSAISSAKTSSFVWILFSNVRPAQRKSRVRSCAQRVIVKATLKNITGSKFDFPNSWCRTMLRCLVEAF